MNWLSRNLYLVPLAPLLAAGISALCSRRQRRLAAGLALVTMGLAFALSCAALVTTLGRGGTFRETHSMAWFQFGAATLSVGWLLDPLTAIMLVMVSCVGLLIFIYSVGYMAQDENFTRFFCFMSLFAAAMLGLVMANSLLLLFICWELVGLASYLLIGFWYHKPSAAAAAKKAFIVTRVGDLGLFLGMLWLYSETGTLLFYDGGTGCLEQSALTKLATQTTLGGLAVSTAIPLLIFCGAIGKSGQVPLHVWLPDAMEGPTPVSALIHAATMVAAGVFLVARVYPLMSNPAAGSAVLTAALHVVTWIGAITAVFAALIAVAQTDIKRILAYSTVSQLGYMMLGLGVGGVALGMFHLITHAFFKALLFLGAGSVIHGCHDQQDIRHMGGLRKLMPLTFATYAVGMMALCGVPLFFSGFWSKDAILHAAQGWSVSHWPFFLGMSGALLTAFYMTRQVCYVFFGRSRAGVSPAREDRTPDATTPFGKTTSASRHHPSVAPVPLGQARRLFGFPHESPPVMTVPLVVLAVGAVLLGFMGTPAWPWFQSYLSGQPAEFKPGNLCEVLPTMLLSAGVVALGIGLAWLLYGHKPVVRAGDPDILERLRPDWFRWLRDRFYVDELYEATVVWLNAALARRSHWLDRFAINGLVYAAAYMAIGCSWLNRLIDEYVVDLGFDRGCGSLRQSSGWLGRLQNGQVQQYLRILGLALTVLVLLLLWGCRP
jgi:NADH-quinone oxidoreductase subunit L